MARIKHFKTKDEELIVARLLVEIKKDMEKFKPYDGFREERNNYGRK